MYFFEWDFSVKLYSRALHRCSIIFGLCRRIQRKVVLLCVSLRVAKILKLAAHAQKELNHVPRQLLLHNFWSALGSSHKRHWLPLLKIPTNVHGLLLSLFSVEVLGQVSSLPLSVSTISLFVAYMFKRSFFTWYHFNLFISIGLCTKNAVVTR